VNFRQDKARLDFSDERVTSWGHDSVEAWSARKGRRTYDEVSTASKVVPALKWYAAMPYKLLDPSVLHRMMPGSLGQILVQFDTDQGRSGDRMLASFRDGLLRELCHTARALHPDAVATARYVSWEDVEGVQLPAEIRVDLIAPIAIQDVQVLRFAGWRPSTHPASHLEKPTDR
jgi:hypothetical protein